MMTMMMEMERMVSKSIQQVPHGINKRYNIDVALRQYCTSLTY
jgi:hypothetical protein